MKITNINHLAFITGDLKTTVHFYRDLLCMPLQAGVGHEGYRHYFFGVGPNQIAFFSYDEAQPMAKKFPGDRTDVGLGFDHVAMTVDTVEELFSWKDRLEAAGVEVTGPVDHGVIWSIYFFDPNNIPLELAWPCVELIGEPSFADDQPLDYVAESSAPQPDRWPKVKNPTPREKWVAKEGNGNVMRQHMIEHGSARMKPELAALLAQRKNQNA